MIRPVFFLFAAVFALSPFGALAEKCTRCHLESQRFSPFHDPRQISCEMCHGGDAESLLQEKAHKDMEAYPGRMATVERSCGQAECHEELIPLVKNSIMHTVAGMVSVTRRILNEESTDPADAPLAERLSEKGVDSYLRKLCVSCHLGTERKSHLQTPKDRGGGCAACHLRSYRKIKRERLTLEEDGLLKVFGPVHPTLTIAIGNERCFGCHSRSGRIALNYIGLAETEEIDRSRTEDFGYLPDRRLVEKKAPDIHSAAGMACIDCHTAAGIMGTGKRHTRKREQVDIQCVDCHLPDGSSPCRENCENEKSMVSFNRREAIYLSLYSGKMPPPKGLNVPVTRRHKTPLLHVRKAEEPDLMFTKSTGKMLEIPKIKQTPDHKMEGHERLNCDSCHSGWAPQCYGCHISFDPDGKQFDHLKRKKTPGRWKESRWAVFSDLPALGVTGSNRIAPFIPGMNLIVDKGNGAAVFSKSYYSSLSPHTTQKKGRSCESCHRSKSALGIIEHRKKSPHDSSWIAPIGWIEEESPQPGRATQPGARSFNAEEIARIEKVGVCLKCHSKEESLFRNYRRSLKETTKSCR